MLWVGFQNRRHLERRKTPSTWPALAVLALVLTTLAVLLVNQNLSGDPLKVRRVLRKL